MDAFKFAFETTIVGLLALPWLVCAILLLIPIKELRVPTKTDPKSSEIDLVSKLLEPAPLGIATLALVYFLGSAVTPLANQLLDDQDLPIIKIRQIRSAALLLYPDWVKQGALMAGSPPLVTQMSDGFFNTINTENCKAPRKNVADCQKKANDLFVIQEQLILREGTNQIDRINRLREQVIVLRGAVFNGLVLVVLCCYGCFSRPYNQPLAAISQDGVTLGRTILTVGLASTLIWIAWHYGKIDLFRRDMDDPPIMELGLLLLGLVGVRTAWKGVVQRSYLPALVLSSLMVVLAYGAWWWTEYLYTKDVVAAFAVRS
jgi:hypothetical protein